MQVAHSFDGFFPSPRSLAFSSTLPEKYIGVVNIVGVLPSNYWRKPNSFVTKIQSTRPSPSIHSVLGSLSSLTEICDYHPCRPLFYSHRRSTGRKADTMIHGKSADDTMLITAAFKSIFTSIRWIEILSPSSEPDT